MRFDAELKFKAVAASEDYGAWRRSAAAHNPVFCYIPHGDNANKILKVDGRNSNEPSPPINIQQ